MALNLVAVNQSGAVSTVPVTDLTKTNAADTISTSQAGIVSKDATDDKSAAFQALVKNYKRVIVDTQIALNSEVFTSISHQQIIGAPTGSLLIGPDMGNSTALRIGGDYSIVDSLQMYNPLEVVDRTIKTTRQGAIGIEAHHVTVRNCHLDQMLHAVYVFSSGEWLGAHIEGNRATNCLGAGAGPNDQTNGWGEDKGDAFTVWGAGARVIGNYAQARSDQDCRIAFHAEGLPGSHSAKNPATDEFDFIFANNHAVGPFRRHFVFEDVKRGIMIGNISAGGATWWPLAFVQTTDCIATNNILHVTRKADDFSGEQWKPQRAAIATMNYSERCVIKDNHCYWADDAVSRAFYSFFKAAEGHNGHVDTIIEGNQFYMNPNSRSRGIDITALTAPVLRNNYIRDCVEPVYGWRTKGTVIIDNLIAERFSKPLYVEGNYDGQIRIVGGSYSNAGTTGLAQTAINIIQTGTVSIKGATVDGLTSLAAIGDVVTLSDGSKRSYLNALTVMGCDSVAAAANVRIDNKTSGEVAGVVNIIGNVNIVGEFSQIQPEQPEEPAEPTA